MRDKVIIALLLAIGIVLPLKVLAHPGNTAPDGCHYCETNCASWGEVYGARHCHGSSTTIKTGSADSLYDLQYKLIAAGESGCSSVSSLRTNAKSQLSNLNSQISSLNNQKNSLVNQIRSQQKAAVDRATTSLALSGGFGSSNGLASIEELRRSYDQTISDTQTEFGFKVKSVQLRTTEYNDFLSFLSEFQSKICNKTTKPSTYTSPTKSVPTTNTKSCPPYSTGTWGTCSCYSGYVWKNDKCVAMNDHCRSKYGNNSYGAIDGEETVCRCNKGYGIIKGKCVTKDADCKNSYGSNSYSKAEDGKDYCYCKEGYTFNSAKTYCIKKAVKKAETPPSVEHVPVQKSKKEIDKPQDKCFLHSVFNSQSQQCECVDGYGLSLNKSYCVNIPANAHYVDTPTDIWLCDEGYEELGNSCMPIKKDDAAIPETDNIETGAATTSVDNELTEVEDHPKPRGGFWGFIQSFFR